ncbi:MAG TPA: phosphoribosyltransferase family protein [Candidatus Paceibacterota bacterium]|nr:hypothetical protein [uncultured archaeon]
MLKSIEKIFNYILDFILPPRTNFAIVKKLDEKAINNLPKAPEVLDCDWIHPLFHYRDPRVKAIIWELKYRENILPLEHIGKILYDEIIGAIADIALFSSDTEFILIPIPITSERRSERGYNQSELICRAIIENDTAHSLLYAPQWFEKIKDTESQSHSQSKHERMQNLVGCFEANPQVEGKIIILIDDVVTTGSTLTEARNTLLSSGARDVFAFTIAH